MKEPKQRHPSKIRRHPSILAALATLTTTTVLAHPGINDRHDVLAAVHDLEHATMTYPVLAALILSLVTATVAYRALNTRRKSHRKQADAVKTQNS
jgi:membrane protein implicated in regulation of membrane protease activity